MKSSNSSPRFSFFEGIAVALVLLAIAVASACYFQSHHYLLYYGDAQAHLNISRSLIDGRTTGYEQLGTVWLPVLHLICLPFVAHDALWESGLAGCIPVEICFVAAGVCLFLCARMFYQNSVAGWVSLLCFALNPNVLYLASITMTEMVFIAGLMLCLLALLRFRETQRWGWVAVAVASSWWMSLTRYDGWFLVPFIVLFLSFLAREKKLLTALVTGLLCALAPLYWCAHNWWEKGNALDFYNGPYSAAAIQGNRPYPGFHNWPQALHYYAEAGRLCSGVALIVLGLAGLALACMKGRSLALIFLSLTPLFYVWSIHSSKTPIHVPTLWPFSYYNSRYGIAVVVWLAFAAGSLATAFPKRWVLAAIALPIAATLPWLIQPNPDEWICWSESKHNSDARRAWTTAAASYLDAHYQPGQGILTEFGDLAGIFGKAHIPLQEALHEGSQVQWFANTMPSGIVHQTKWAIAQEGDLLDRRLQKGNAYYVVYSIAVAGAPRLLIYERS